MNLNDYIYNTKDRIKLHNADCLSILKGMKDNSVDCMVTDPPYGISFMSKEWDTFNEVIDIQKEFKDTVYAKKGFKKLPRNKPFGMIKFFVPIWKEMLRVLKPGAFVFVMCAPRQDVLSKQIIALQEAGFETGFSSIYWSYATGFPKASNISKMVDKQECKKELTKKLGKKPTKKEFDEVWKNYRKIISKYDAAKQKGSVNWQGKDRKDGKGSGFKEMAQITQPKSLQAKELDGSYSGFQPKPAVEIIIVAMKPLSEKTYVDQALKNGKGITWLNNCRIPHNEEQKETKRQSRNENQTFSNKSCGFKSENLTNASADPKGRFPANLLVSNDVLNDGKISKSIPHTHNHKKETLVYGNGKGLGIRKEDSKYNDSGSYSRYFDLDKWWIERVKKLPESVQKVFPYLIVPKASKREKNKGCEKLEEKTGGGMKGTEDLTLLTGSGNVRNNKMKNNHPTVKPIKLMSYLITLGSREGDIVLDPFMGSGTTGIACKLLNRKFIGIEMNKDYFEIAQARIKGC